MPLFELRKTPQVDRQIDILLKFFDKLRRPTSLMTSRISRSIRREFLHNFESQGSGRGRWAPLAPITISDRLRQGFPPGPILVRTGDYKRGFIMRTHPDHELIVDINSNGWTHEEGSGDRRIFVHETGTSRVPQRSVTLLSPGSEDAIADDFEQLVISLEP